MSEKIFEDIQVEREHQDKRWGGPDSDDHNVPGDWMSYIHEWTDKAIDFENEHLQLGALPKEDLARFRKYMIKVAALAVAAIEAVDRV